LKKFLSLLTCALFIFGIAAVAAAADLDVSGDARIRGHMLNNYDMDSDVDDDTAWYDQEFNLKANVMAGDTKVSTRIVLSEADWGTGGTAGAAMVDHAYITFPAGPVTVVLGLQPVNFGTKFVTWDATRDRIKVVKKLDAGKVGLWIDKNTETLNPAGEGLMNEDKDTIGIFGGGIPAGPLSFGFRVWQTMDKTGVEDKNGTVINPLLTGEVGGMNLAFEAVFKTGELNTDANDDKSPMGIMLMLTKPMDALTVSGAFAMTSAGQVCDDEFTPTALFGSDQGTALVDFGGGINTGDSYDTMAIVVGADYAMSDVTTLNGKVAYAILDEFKYGGVIVADPIDGNIIEIDAGVSYALSESTNYSATLTYGMPGGDLFDDADPIMGVSHGVEVEF
jgi:hypothetical protein